MNTLIIVIVVFVLGIVLIAYYAHRNDINQQAESQGGMLKKYNELIESLLGDDPNSRIMKVASSYVKLGVKYLGGSIVFTIRQDVNTILISYRLKNKMNGSTRELNWEFPDNLDHKKIMEKIRLDIAMDNIKSWSTPYE